MNKTRVALSVASLFVFSVFVAASAEGHMTFKKQLQKKYPGVKVSCNACHVKGKPKTDRSEFGKLFAKELKKTHPTLSADFKGKKGQAKKDFEAKTMLPAFDKALKIVKKAKNKKGETYDSLIKSFQIADITKDAKYKPPGSGKK